MSSPWRHHDWWQWEQESWQQEQWEWKQQPWKGSSYRPRRGRARPAKAVARIDPAHLRKRSPSADRSSSSSAAAARKKGAWRDKKHVYEDHEVLRCPWPGGKWSLPKPGEEGCWRNMEAEAIELGLALTLV